MSALRKGLFGLLIVLLVLAGLLPALPAHTAVAQAGPACHLLDDPAVRRRMSAPFEEALLQLCGRAPAPEVPGASFRSPIAGGILLGPDVRVNAFDPPGSPSAVQSETSIAINRNSGTICAAWNDRYHWYGEGTSYIGFARSTDGGQTFTDGGYMPPYAGGRARGDPSLAWRALDGYFYFTSIFLTAGGQMQLGFWRSTDDCATFQWVGLVHAGPSDDKELMAIDNNPASPYYGRFYVTWMNFGSGGLSVTYSDNGTSWSTPVVLSYDSVQGPWPAVDPTPSGDVYVAWLRWGYNDLNYIEVARSTNGGQSFSRVQDAASGVVNPYDEQASNNCGRDALKANADDGIRYLPSPQIVVGPDRCLHVVYSYDPDGHNVGDVVDSFYRRSCTFGASWEAEHRLNDDTTTTDQFFPAITVNESNIVAASWYDRRLDPANNWYFDRYMALSTDGGTTWDPNRRVSDVSSPVWIDDLPAYCYHGDYDQMESTPAAIYVLWSDDRDYYGGHNDSDIYLDRESLACDPVQGVGFTWEPLMPIAGNVVTFTAMASGTPPITYEWKLDVGTWETGQVVTHSYSLPGVYTVVLTAANCVSATATVMHTITVAACEPVQGAEFTWEPSTPWTNQTVTFTGTAFGGSGGWVTETVDSGSRGRNIPSLALDAEGRPHIAYQDFDLGLKYAFYDGAGWVTTTLDSSGYANYPSLALDADGFPHIAYWHTFNSQVKYAYYDGATWHLEVVESIPEMGEYLSLVLDGAGHPHISYVDSWNAELKHAYNDGSGWQIEVVEQSSAYGYTSLALDAAGHPHISYWGPTAPSGALLYAYFDGTQWVTTTVDEAYTGLTSLALDAEGHPHISYHSNWTLRYATFDGTDWVTETVDGEPYTGWYSSLRLDAAGLPRISYEWMYPSAGSAIRYAWRDGATWRIGTVDGQSGVGGRVSMSLDAAARPHVSYSYVDGGDIYGLRYAWLDAFPPSEPISYAWDFGDGSPAVVGPSAIVTHTYAQAGLYTVAMTATNCATATATAIHTITVVQPCDPVHGADFSWVPPVPLAGQVVTLTGAASGTLPITYTWNLGDGSPIVRGPSPVVSHTYALPGLYTVTLTATNCATATARAVHTITVVQPCEAVHDAAFDWLPITPTVGEVVILTGTASGTLPITYTWNLGDGSPIVRGPSPVVSHTYALPGLYTVVMTATNCATATATAVHTIAVVQPCEAVHDAAFAWLPITPTVGEAVVFTGAASGTLPITYTWNFGDGSAVVRGPSSVVSHTYDLPGLYTVVMTAANCATATATTSGTLTVLPSCQNAEILSVTTAITGCVVALGAQVSGSEPIAYLWQSGAMSSTMPAVVWDFGATGTYSVTLQVWNCGGAGHDERTFIVTVECRPTWQIYLPLVWKG